MRAAAQWNWRMWAVALILAGIIAGMLFDAFFGRIIPLRPEAIRAWLVGLGAWAPLVFILLMATAVVVTPIPSVPLDITAGLVFGLVGGTVLTLIGAELGAVIAFTLARWLGRPRLAKRIPAAAMARVDDLTRRSGFRALLVMRLLPVFNFDWVSYAAGLTPISLPAFAIATFLGMIPPVIGIVAVGATLPGNPILAGSIFTILLLGVVVPLAWPWLRLAKRASREA